MVRLSQTTLSLALLGMVLLASIDTFFGPLNGPGFTYKNILVYLIILSLAPYVMKETRVEKKKAVSGMFLVMSFAFISVNQYIFSLHKYELLPASAAMLAAAFAFMAFCCRTAAVDKKNGAVTVSPVEFMGLAAVLVFALAVRLYRFDSIPPGIWFDEAVNGNETLRLLYGSEPPPVFIERLTMMPAMFFYISSAFMKFFGENIYAMRYVSVFAGVLSVAAFYFLARRVLHDHALALCAAFLPASSRWHITFSRVAFIGMLTLLLGTIFLYYYIRMIEDGKKGDAILSGIALGLSMYTFSGANFFPIAALLHSLWLVFSGGLKFVRRRWAPLLIAAVTATAVAAPLMQYAVKNFDSFSQRMKDVSVINDIKTEKSIIPIVKSVRSHLLMFNFEGDYNGRHNLYKKPMLDNIGGVLFIAGFFAAFFTKGWSLFIVWFFTLLCAGISTLSIEAPQAYRIIGILPAVYLFMALALKKIAAMLTGFNPKKVLLSGILPALCLSAGAINIHQYFVLYPQEKATYLSFSPEANAIARFINANHEKYAIYLAVPDSMYGFYPLEQKIICDFLTRGGRSFEYMKEENRVDDQSLAGKERVVLIVRPSEEGIISAIEREFPKAVREEHPNPYGDENLFVCYHIDPAMIKHKDGRFGPMILYR